MSVIKHLQIDIWNTDCLDNRSYFEFPADIPQRNCFSDFTRDAFHIMVDGGEIWSYNSIPTRAGMFVGRKVLVKSGVFTAYQHEMICL